ncbi:MAG: hypothetical protein RL346_943 [Verrucomicrobiota bacterium]|jgi:hypothetical protein
MNIDERKFVREIDPIEQESGDPLAVLFDLSKGAAPLTFHIAVESARVRIPFSVTIA